ncbi:glutamine-hydrolyzing GMP synthase [Blattabacterium cuenoti]|uniref:glutamine-hydrolyzing GMP synthase n=1 Tax=Blattabacterium cuenoti TaxID=1653831 RepID=UPI00163C2D14|nr:glutamine-hydrolyzing GMP synthase [Blattabacterium cuenoti]
MKIGELIIVLDFGSQYSNIIVRRIRHLGVHTILCSHNISIYNILSKKPKGIILSGGPFSVYNNNAPLIYKNILELNIPILGICYGMQLISFLFGGKIESSKNKEYGKSYLKIIDEKNPLFLGIPKKSIIVWMSHSDETKEISEEFKVIGKTTSCSIAAFCHKKKNIYALQFHPEVSHTEFGMLIIKNFILKICKCNANFKLKNIIKKSIDNITKIVSKKKVILGISGGLDSFVAASLIYKAIGDSLHCIFVNNGLLLEEEEKSIDKICSIVKFPINIINAKNQFLSKLTGIIDPEKKRKIIGEEFIKIFEKESKKIKNVEFLAQGTIYSDVIESSKDSSKLSVNPIKSHHNVGGLPKTINLKLLEPLKKFFKDEVIEIGYILGLPKYLLYKHPFPGPGISIRIIGEINEKKISILRKAENILFQELNNYKLYTKLNQAFIILLPIKSVGIMGDKRSYEYTAILRSINTKDFMTATFSNLSYEFLEKVSNRIINEVDGINRMLYDISSKPPSTIEWE